jgi:hypothetical protein
MNYFQAMFN